MNHALIIEAVHRVQRQWFGRIIDPDYLLRVYCVAIGKPGFMVFASQTAADEFWQDVNGFLSRNSTSSSMIGCSPTHRLDSGSAVAAANGATDFLFTRIPRMIRLCFAGCGRTIKECMGFGLARDVIAIQDGHRKIMARELCGVCVEHAARDRAWFEAKIKDSE